MADAQKELERRGYEVSDWTWEEEQPEVEVPGPEASEPEASEGAVPERELLDEPEPGVV